MKETLDKPISLRLPIRIKGLIAKLARDNCIPVASQIRILINLGLFNGKRPSNKRLKSQ